MITQRIEDFQDNETSLYDTIMKGTYELDNSLKTLKDKGQKHNKFLTNDEFLL